MVECSRVRDSLEQSQNLLLALFIDSHFIQGVFCAHEVYIFHMLFSHSRSQVSKLEKSMTLSLLRNTTTDFDWSVRHVSILQSGIYTQWKQRFDNLNEHFPFS